MALLFIMIGVMLFEVVSRRWFNSPTLWAYDLSYMLNGSLFIGASGYTLLKNGHTRIDFFSSKLPIRTQHIILAVCYAFLFLPAMYMVCSVAVHEAYNAFVTNQLERVSPWAPRVWPYYSAIALGLCVLAFQCVLQLIRSIIGAIHHLPLAAQGEEEEHA